MFDDVPELVTVKRKNSSEEIYKILFSKDKKILSSERIDMSEYPKIVSDVVKLAEKYTIAPKSEIFFVVSNLYEKNKIQQDWSGIDNAIKEFNSHSVLKKTISEWVPQNRIGKGEAQFKILFKTKQGIPEPDFVPEDHEGYSIKFFGKNGKSGVLSGEFIDKFQTENLDTPLHNILKILNVPEELQQSKKITGNVSLDCENLQNNAKCSWEITSLSSGISAKDIKIFSEKLKDVFESNKFDNFDLYINEFKKNIKKNIDKIKKHLLHEHKDQKGIIGICGDDAIKIDSIDQLSISYIRTNLRIMFCYQENSKNIHSTSLESFLDI